MLTLLVVILWGAIPGPSRLEGAVAVSNLNEFDLTGNQFYSKNSWGANRFTTGSHQDGYFLDAVTGVFMDNPVNHPGDPQSFEARIYADDSGKPSVILDRLSGPQPAMGEIEYVTFESEGLMLAPETSYWLAYTSQDSFFDAVVLPRAKVGEFSSSFGWSINGGVIESLDQGATWTVNYDFSIPFSIAATPVPEPQEIGWMTALTLGALVWGVRCRRRLLRD